MNYLPSLDAARLVVPIPLKGSNTISFLYEYIFNNLSINSIGYGAGCVSFLHYCLHKAHFQILYQDTKYFSSIP